MAFSYFSRQVEAAPSGSVIGRFLTGDRGRTITALVSSAVIAILAIKLLT